MKTNLRLFTFKTGAFSDESLVEMPGFSHRSQPFKQHVTWYPFEEWFVTVYLYAQNRSHAVRQLLKVGRNDVRDLDGGRRCETPECMKSLRAA